MFRVSLPHYGAVSATVLGDSTQPVRVILAQFAAIRTQPLFRIPQPLDVALADMALKGALATLDRHGWAWHNAVPLWLINVLARIPRLSLNLCQFFTQFR